MRILMLGNSLTSAQDMPDILAELTGRKWSAIPGAGPGCPSI